MPLPIDDAQRSHTAAHLQNPAPPEICKPPKRRQMSIFRIERSRQL